MDGEVYCHRMGQLCTDVCPDCARAREAQEAAEQRGAPPVTDLR